MARFAYCGFVHCPLGNLTMLTGAARVANPCAACAVREQAVCAALSPGRLQRLIAIVTRVSFEPDQILFLEGEPDEYAFNISEGIARLSKMLSDGRRLVTAFVHPGDFIGLTPRHAYACTAEAVTALRVCRFPKAGLQAFFRDNPGMERRVLAMASAELWDAQSQLMLLGRKTARERLASFLRNWPSRPLPSGKSAWVIDLPMTRTDIADHLGLTPETVCRTFTALVKEGIVEMPLAERIILSRPNRLEKIAEGES
jgi:CRP/FNR family transcriptional regulator